MTNIVRAFALAAVLAGGLTTAAAAQVVDVEPEPRSNAEGFHLGLFLNGSAITVEDSEEVESGPGGGLHLGYGFNRNLSVFLRANLAAIEPAGGGDSFDLTHADLGLRYSFGGPGSVLRPFVLGAVSGRAVSISTGAGPLEGRGPGFTAGGGLEYFLSRSVALEAGLSLSFGSFNEGRLDGGEWVDLESESFDATSSRFDLGFSWHP